MVPAKWIVSVILAVSTASATAFNSPVGSRMLERDDLAMMKREENITVGSPLYNCHDNCGQAILEISECSSSICEDETFLTDYQNCLQCSGPDNEDIWQSYGPELNSTAASCGLSTSPQNGTQDSAGVGDAIAASNSTSACAAATSAYASSTATATGLSASPSSATNALAASIPRANLAAYGAIAVGALYATGL